ncbi:MAG TPA: hypothetical protein VMD05_00420 [Candidatus Nanoarchaeia archaeon]|nr:hypothetical protein [Candidatus Nanoarchaeia archaeon]
MTPNITKRFRNAFPKMDFMKNKHEACANFDDGSCRVFHFTNLDPKGSACPHFKAKDKLLEAETGHTAGAK